MKCLDALFPETGGQKVLDDLWLSKYTLQHGDLSRLPSCLQPPGGSAVSLHCLENWHKDDPFDIAVVDDLDYTQVTINDLPPMTFYRLGAPVMLTNIHYRIPELNTWVVEVSNELGIPYDSVKVNGWFARQAHGLGVHYDPGEVILIQLVGTKRMRIGVNKFTTMPDTQYELAKPCSQSELPLFLNGFPGPEPENMEEIELRPGSVLTMPRGIWHDSLAMDTDSVAVALFLRPPTALDFVLPYLREILRQDPRWRIPLGYNSNNMGYKSTKEMIELSLESLEGVIHSIHPEQVIAHAEPMLKRTRLLKKAPYTLQRLPEANLSIKAHTNETCQITLRARLDIYDTKVSQMELNNDVLGALEWISNCAARFTIEDINTACPELSTDYIEGLLEALLETNYLVLLPFQAVKQTERDVNDPPDL